MTFAVRAVIGAVVAVVLWCAVISLFTHHARFRAQEAAPISSASADEYRPGDSEADGTIDLYGNDVVDAVAKYSLDATGSLYEVHSPQTEIPKLGSPKS